MEFESFEQALTVCIEAEDGSEQQAAAMFYCIDNAPPHLKEEIKEQFLAAKNAKSSCGCGCGHDHNHKDCK